MFSLIWGKFSDEWLNTARAAVLFFICSILTLALIPAFLGKLPSNGRSFWFEVFWGGLGVVGAPAVLFLWVGMWRYWAHVDTSPKWARRIWFVILLTGFWYGSVLYCGAVYLPRRRQNKDVATTYLRVGALNSTGLTLSKKCLVIAWTLWILVCLSAFVAPRSVDRFLLRVLPAASILLVLLTLGHAVVWLYQEGMRADK
jgi:hypothetical protein